ncbi:MAG: alpha/beta hydrolase, partial [Prevotellaceae bacterium]|nr:alpha/beta hydrolase [Prevotellaceae bacterium]
MTPTPKLFEPQRKPTFAAFALSLHFNLKDKMMKKVSILMLAGIIISATSINQLSAQAKEMNQTEHYTFQLSDNVTRTHVSYRNRFGITLSGDLYMPKDLDANKQYPALVIGPPFGGVKEQGPGVYANQMAQRGFVVLAFDPSYNGASGGEPRRVSSPDVFAEDFSAGVDYLGTRPFVDRSRIGAIGICGSGGFAIAATQVDTRIKAVVASAMYDISGMGSQLTGEMRKGMLDRLGAQRWTDFENGEPEYTPTFPVEPDNVVPAGMTGNEAEFYSYYGLPRGHHPNARGGTTSTSMYSWINFQLMNHIKQISPRPILFVTGDIAHSRAFSETAYAAAAEPKELYIV